MNDTQFRPRVLWVSPEVAPYASTGGLAEVSGAMPRCLHAAGWPVAVLMPCYPELESSLAAPAIVERWPLPVELAGRVYETEVLCAVDRDGLPLRLLRADALFGRRGIYAEGGYDYPDNHLRFAVLSKAACELARREGYEILHLNDWSVALAAVFLATHYRQDAALARLRVLQSIHNLAHPGCFHTRTLDDLGLARELGRWNLMGHLDEVSWLKGGILLADALHTVSPRYAQEILTPEYGNGMDGLLRLRHERLRGVLNGIDYQEWDPARNTRLSARFSADDLRGKARCKQFLLETFGLRRRAGRPLIAFLGRMVPQKGLDLLLDLAPGLIARGAQIVILGSGLEELERRCRQLAQDHPDAVGVHIGFERSLAHQVTSGADMVVMPSIFEPCGLTQLQAMRYGTIPVVHAVGGLVDTVCNTTAASLSSNRATGFVFRTLSERALLLCLNRAMKFHADRRTWTRLMRNAMRQDFSWQASLPGYVAMYRSLFDHEPWRSGFDLPAPGHAAPAEPAPFIDWGPSLPDRYHEDAIRLMVQSPTQLYVYWEVAPGRGGSGRFELIVEREGEGETAATGLGEVGELWVGADADRAYRVRLIDGDGRELLRSNIVRTPRLQPSPWQEARWIGVEERRRRYLEARRRRARRRGEELPPWAFDELERARSVTGGPEPSSSRPAGGRP